MKYILFFLIFIGGIYVYITRPGNTSENDQREASISSNPPSISIATPENSIDIPFGQTSYTLYYSRIDNGTITVIPNFSEKVSAASIAEKNDCRKAGNGGFYTEEDTPLGLFRLNGAVLSNEREETNLITGFFYIGQSGDPGIGREYPEDAPTIIQTGPFFSRDDTFTTVQDKPARRTLIIETTSGQLYIASITAKGTAASGPYLSVLPEILFSVDEPFEVQYILNLDGGAASFYKDESGFTLSEFTHVGSVICVK